MEWISDVSAGDWLRERLSPDFSGGLHSFVPAGFAAYGRVCYPMWRDNSPTINGDPDALVHEDVTWAQVAAAFGTVLHPLAQSHALMRQEWNSNQEAIVNGWRYSIPPIGTIEPATMTPLATVLAAHTATPDDGFAAVWEGWGDLPAWCDTSPKLELPGRNYILFKAGITEFIKPDWPQRAPWNSESVFHDTPSICWPADHSWVLANEIDFDTAIVAGSAALIEVLQHTPGMEALPISLTDKLYSDSDLINK
ncbi:MAG: hypothetical protein LBR20_01650 [Propionibacteriaceae bacterium]|jgi:hypothetical protein|nr:hypothetical protein [Propionibacteriaceae bacterium]